MTKLISLLVGSHFQQGAKRILLGLPNGTPLDLVPDPTNPYDENAIKVFIRREALPEEGQELEALLEGTGADPEAEAFCLGHIAASGGKPLAKAKEALQELVGNLEFLPHLGFSPPAIETTTLGSTAEGLPTVILEVK